MQGFGLAPVKKEGWCSLPNDASAYSAELAKEFGWAPGQIDGPTPDIWDDPDSRRKVHRRIMQRLRRRGTPKE